MEHNTPSVLRPIASKVIRTTPRISTTLDEYVYTPDDEVVEGEIETGKRYIESDFNKVIEIKEREVHRVKLFMDQIKQNDKTNDHLCSRPGGILLTASNRDTIAALHKNLLMRISSRLFRR
jgi:hypothetical protein